MFFGSFVGIDFSGGKVRTVQIKKGLKGKELIKSSFDENRGPGFLGDVAFEGFLSATGICSSPALLRVLSFPFSSSKKINEVFRFELESSAGFSLGEDILSDFHEVKGSSGSELIASAFSREVLEDHLASAREAGVDPGCVTFSAVAFSSLEEFMEGERPFLLIDVDRDHLNFSFFDESGLRRVRNCDDAMARLKKSLGWDSLDFGEINLDPASRDAFFEGCDIIAQEIRKTARYFGGETGAEVKGFVLSGDICEVEGVERVLGGKLGDEIKRIFIPDLGYDSPFFARAYSIALYGSSVGRNGGLNLRRGRYGTADIGKELLKTFRVPMVLFACLVLVAVFGRATAVVSAKGQISSVRSEIERELDSEFPAALGTPDPVAFSRKRIETVLKKLEIAREVRGPRSPLEVLMAVSSGIPKNVDLTVDEIRIEDEGRVRIRGRCGYYNEIALIEKSFSDSESFSDVRSEQVIKAVNDTIKFEISMVAR